MTKITVVNNPAVVACEDENLSKHLDLWIDRSGVCYPVPSCGHARWAMDYTKHEETGLYCTASELEKAGWIHLSYRNAYCIERRLTRSQVDKLILWCEKHDRKYSETMNDVSQYYTNAE